MQRERQMFVAGSSDQWSWSEDAFPPVAFCVRALVLDGLKVPPFDRHADGDGELRALGLDAERWHEWLASILAAQKSLHGFARHMGEAGPGRTVPDPAIREGVRAAGEALRFPGSTCPGPPELQARLNALWGEYAPEGEVWKRRMSDVGRRGSVRHQRALWDALIPYHSRLDTLTVFLVEYPEPIVMPIAPASCLIAPANEPEAYGRQVVAAAEAFAAQT